MARLSALCFTLALLLLFADLSIFVRSDNSPAPSPQNGASLPPHKSPSPNSPSPAPSPYGAPQLRPDNPPPAPPPREQSPSPSSPAPAPNSSNINQETNSGGDVEDSKASSGRLTGGQKAGIAFGVIIGVGAVGMAGLIYKKRKDNIRRSQYGYAARREML